MSGGFRKVKHIFSQLAFVYVLAAGWSRANENNTLASGCSRAKNKTLTHSAGKAINAYGWNFSLLSSSYQLQYRYASRMCLVENAQHERIFTYIQSRFARTKPCVNCFVHRYCFVFVNYIVSSKFLFEILENFFKCLETQNSILKTRFSILETRDVRGRSRIYRDPSRIYRVGFRDFWVEKTKDFSHD